MVTTDRRTDDLEADIADLSRAVARRLEVIARRSTEGYQVPWQCPTCGHEKRVAASRSAPAGARLYQ